VQDFCLDVVCQFVELNIELVADLYDPCHRIPFMTCMPYDV